MLGNVVDKKMGKRRRKSGNNNSSRLNASSSAKNGGKDQHDTSGNKKITDYFPVRRSNRKTANEIKDQVMKSVKALIDTRANEEHLEIYHCKIKGRGIRTLKPFKKGEFVVEYKGDIISVKIAQIREEEYAKDEQIGSYMYYFKHGGKDYCVDATEETPYKGRLVNHSYLRSNLKTKVLDFGTRFNLVLTAKRDIDVGEELLYDYGERRPEVVERHPWLLNS